MENNDYIKEVCDYLSECLEKNQEHNKMMNWRYLKTEEEKLKYKTLFEKYMEKFDYKNIQKYHTASPITCTELKDLTDSFIKSWYFT